MHNNEFIQKMDVKRKPEIGNLTYIMSCLRYNKLFQFANEYAKNK